MYSTVVVGMEGEVEGEVGCRWGEGTGRQLGDSGTHQTS